MGYDLHITRAIEWSAVAPATQITKAHWMAYIRTDPDAGPLCEQNALAAVDLHNDHDLCVTWATSDGPWPVIWSHGQIEAKDPPPALVVKLCRMAKQLDAQVQGDDGEHYCEPQA